ncbi:MAG TPA: hypothetical protein DEB39_07400 [Planctomycetaceae bacterium]|nr:hypothetical protein [Planctomycetaceae bacterium]
MEQLQYLDDHFPTVSAGLAVFLPTLLVFGLFMLSLLCGIRLGTIRGRCSCGTAKRVLNEMARRAKQPREVAAYDPQKLDPAELPLVH